MPEPPRAVLVLKMRPRLGLTTRAATRTGYQPVPITRHRRSVAGSPGRRFSAPGSGPRTSAPRYVASTMPSADDKDPCLTAPSFSPDEYARVGALRATLTQRGHGAPDGFPVWLGLRVSRTRCRRSAFGNGCGHGLRVVCTDVRHHLRASHFEPMVWTRKRPCTAGGHGRGRRPAPWALASPRVPRRRLRRRRAPARS